MQRKNIYLIFIIFTISGFSGLIYESIWTHYLKLFLGHAAYAQTLVLAIFMGGMALGSWICSRYSRRWPNLLAGYALAEGLIGLAALVFHPLFDQAVQFSYDAILPHFGSATLASTYKWTLSALMILPQSILLGMTFPLMSGGVIRLSPQNPGRTIALLYFTNSIGAAFGVLASGFLLIGLIGLPGTMRLAGLINCALALAVWLLARKQKEASLFGSLGKDTPRESSGGTWPRLLLLAAFITGAASFIYEIGWIRMLSLVMGSSTHAFELMLSAFILGLALGGLWIHRRIDRIPIPERYLATVQVVMGLLALSTLPLYGQTFDVMRWLVNALSKTDRGYALFNLSSNAIALMVMLPTTFCAGMTLPLITYALIRKGYGERSIGAVYAANTLGAIAGVFFAIHVGLPFLGLKGLIACGAAGDMALGAALLWLAGGYADRRRPAMITALAIGAVAATVFFINLDPYKMASEVYRTGELLQPEAVEFKYYRDGKTATISAFLEKATGVVAINTNGKTDASINMSSRGLPSGDEPTMILAAVLPMALNPQARTVANIGLGSGLTSHTLLSNPQLQQVDTVEIERFVLDAAQNFRPRVDLVYTDPRSAIYIDDAKTFFSVHNRQYDIIISEPSNPWISGVASLFSEEFYRLLNRHLTDNGLFVQWLQLYEVDNDLVLSVLKAISHNFSDFAAFAAHDRDMLIVARKNGALGALDRQVFAIPAISAALERIYIKGAQDIELRRMGGKKFLDGLLAASPVRANSDYFPFVDLRAGRTRFLQANAFDFHNLAHDRLPLREMLEGVDPSWENTEVTFPSFYVQSQSAYKAMALRDYCLNGSFGPRYGHVPPAIQRQALQFRQIFYERRPSREQAGREVLLYTMAADLIPYLRPQEMEVLWEKLEAGPGAQTLSAAERDWIALFKAAGRRDAGAMVRGAKTLLDDGRPIPPEGVKFLGASGMAGALMQGDREEASRLWSLYRGRMFGAGPPDLSFRLLAAEAGVAGGR